MSDLDQALWNAAKMGRLKEIKKLLAHGADVNVCGPMDTRPIYLAVATGQTAAVQFLLEKGANVNVVAAGGATPLLLASQPCTSRDIPTALALLGAGIDVNKACSFDGAAPLHHASQLGHLELVQLLISRGADIDMPGPKGCTPLLLAAEHGHRELVRLFISHGAAVNCAAADGFTPLRMTTQNGHRDIIMLLRAAGAVA